MNFVSFSSISTMKWIIYPNVLPYKKSIFKFPGNLISKPHERNLIYKFSAHVISSSAAYET